AGIETKYKPMPIEEMFKILKEAPKPQGLVLLPGWKGGWDVYKFDVGILRSTLSKILLEEESEGLVK
ncbi:unnamed protein product, partial [marine sediment metagenome]